MFFFSAAGIPTVICVICYKCVRSLWLLKGGKKVRVQTFAPFFMNSTLEVPVENISGMTSRAGQNYVSFQLKRNDNKLLRLSMSNLSGTFKEPILYDNYVGKFRNLKSSWFHLYWSWNSTSNKQTLKSRPVLLFICYIYTIHFL